MFCLINEQFDQGLHSLPICHIILHISLYDIAIATTSSKFGKEFRWSNIQDYYSLLLKCKIT